MRPRKPFYVVQFLEPPSEDIDDYVCIPMNWLIMLDVISKPYEAIVAYPEDEDPFITRDRAKRSEIRHEHWYGYTAHVKYESDSYWDADYWITRSNDLAIEEYSKIGTQFLQPRFKLNITLNSTAAVKRDKTVLRMNPQKPVPRPCIKRLAPENITEPLPKKQPKLYDATRQTSAADKPGCSKRDESTVDQSNHLENARSGELAAGPSISVNMEIMFPPNPSNKHPSTRQHSKESPRFPVRNNDKSVEVVTIDKEDYSQVNRQTGEAEEDAKKKVLTLVSRAMLSFIDSFIDNGQVLPAILSRNATKHIKVELATAPQNVSASTISGLPSSEQIALSQLVDPPAARCPRFVDRACQTDVSMIKKPLSYHGVASNYKAVKDQEAISDHEMSTRKAPFESINNVDRSGMSTENYSTDRPPAVHVSHSSSSTNDQTHRGVVSEQQMLGFLSQITNFLSCTNEMWNNLRSSIFETAGMRPNLLETSANNASHSGTGTSETPHETDHRQNGGTATEKSGTSRERNNNVNSDVNTAPETKQLWKLYLPPEYDPHDTRWTLRYPENMPGLMELVPGSGVYVRHRELHRCQKAARTCTSLVQNLLREVFHRNALRVCMSLTEEAQVAKTSDAAGPDVRPKLDKHACDTFLAFIQKYGRQRGWKTDVGPILNRIHSIIQKTRYLFAEM